MYRIKSSSKILLVKRNDSTPKTLSTSERGSIDVFLWENSPYIRSIPLANDPITENFESILE